MDTLLRQRDVLDLLQVSRATLTNWRKDGNFPAPRKLGPRVLAWRREDVDAWILSK